MKRKRKNSFVSFGGGEKKRRVGETGCVPLHVGKSRLQGQNFDSHDTTTLILSILQSQLFRSRQIKLIFLSILLFKQINQKRTQVL